MNFKRNAWRLFTAVSLFCVTGCYSEKDAPKKLTQSQSEYLALFIITSQINALQTNWTVTVSARTNN